jgi:hypothetical protein
MKANADRPSTPGKTKRPIGRGKCPSPPMPASALLKKKKVQPTVPEVEA